MSAVVPPPPRTPKVRKVIRRVKAYRCYQGCLACCLLALFAFGLGTEVKPFLSIWVHLVGYVASVVAVVSAIGAVVYRAIEAPQEVTVLERSRQRKEPPLIHFKRGD